MFGAPSTALVLVIAGAAGGGLVLLVGGVVAGAWAERHGIGARARAAADEEGPRSRARRSTGRPGRCASRSCGCSPCCRPIAVARSSPGRRSTTRPTESCPPRRPRDAAAGARDPGRAGAGGRGARRLDRRRHAAALGRPAARARRRPVLARGCWAGSTSSGGPSASSLRRCSGSPRWRCSRPPGCSPAPVGWARVRDVMARSRRRRRHPGHGRDLGRRVARRARRWRASARRSGRPPGRSSDPPGAAPTRPFRCPRHRAERGPERHHRGSIASTRAPVRPDVPVRLPLAARLRARKPDEAHPRVWTRSSTRSATRSATSSPTRSSNSALQSIAVYLVHPLARGGVLGVPGHAAAEREPGLPYLAAALIILFTPVLFLFGIIVYRIVRPREDRRGQRAQPRGGGPPRRGRVDQSCPACHRRINEEWIICPTCRTQLNRVCANCGRLVGLDWALCAWCGQRLQRADIPAYQPIAGTWVYGQPRASRRRPPASVRASSTAGPPRSAAAVRMPRAHSEHHPGGPRRARRADAPPERSPPTARPARPASLEGRAGPGAVRDRWLGLLVGAGLLLVSFLAGAGSSAAPWLSSVGLVLGWPTGLLPVRRAPRPSSAAAGRTSAVPRSSAWCSPSWRSSRWPARQTRGTRAARPGRPGSFGSLAGPRSPAITMLADVGVVRLAVVGTGGLSRRRDGVVRPGAAAAPRPRARGALFALPVLVLTLLLGALLAGSSSPRPAPCPSPATGRPRRSICSRLRSLRRSARSCSSGGSRPTAWARAAGAARQAIVRGATSSASPTVSLPRSTHRSRRARSGRCSRSWSCCRSGSRSGGCSSPGARCTPRSASMPRSTRSRSCRSTWPRGASARTSRTSPG